MRRLFCEKSDSFTIPSCVTSEAIKICIAIIKKQIEKFVKIVIKNAMIKMS